MESNNRYTDINPTVIWQIKFYAKYLKNSEYFVDEQLEDIEQELLVQVWPLLNQYDWNKGKFSVFSNLVIKSRTSNLMASAKRSRMPSIEMSDKEYFINTTHIDIESIISRLPKKLQSVCEQLKFFNLVEVARMNNMSRTTLYYIIQKLRVKFHSLKIN